MDQKVQTFATNPQAWTTFRNSIYQHYRNTNVWNAISSYFPEQFDQSKFTAWLNNLIPERPENNNTLIEETVLCNFLEDALEDQ
ncbi:hypothetical protein IJM86_08160 [bacterium]|nr:hypothetical protein [bacterium]